MSLLTKEQVLELENNESFAIILSTLVKTLGKIILRDINLHSIVHFLIKVLGYDDPRSIKVSEFESICISNGDYFAELEIKNSEITEETWSALLETVMDSISKGKYTVEDLVIFSLNYTGVDSYTPEFILKLANSILDIQPNDKVADIQCNSGDFIIEAWKTQDKASFFGCEENIFLANCSSIRTDLLDGEIYIENTDPFELVENNSKKFDKIFSNYPLKVRISDLGCGKDYLNRLRERIPSISKATTSDWIYNSLLCDLLDENGKAVAIMTNGSTWNRTDKAVRQYFIENGFVEAVISLPAKLFSSYTGISTSMIIFSKGNSSVRIVDATNFFESGRRKNELSDENILSIISALQEDGQYSIRVSNEELRDNEYNLNFNRYTKYKMLMENMVAFDSVIKNITRGAAIKADELDKITTNEVTNKNYLMLGNIQDGIIDEELPYLSEIEKNLEKYCLKYNNLVFSKNGYPFKIAVATPKEGQQILANGNLYIIEIDEEKANPYYLKSFFESEQGISLLKSIVVGSTIPNIGVESLKSLQIPLPSIEEQNKIAQKYQATQDEVKILKLRLAKTLDRLYHTFDEEDCDEGEQF